MAAPMRLLFQKIHHLSVQHLTSSWIYSRTIYSVNKSESQSRMLVHYFRQLAFSKCANATHRNRMQIRRFLSCNNVSTSMTRLTSNSINSNVYSPLYILQKVASAASLKRWMTTGLTGDMLRKEMDKLTDRFMETKELLDDARESMGSVYFNEDLQDADRAVEETLAEYQRLLSELDNGQRQTVTRAIGLKMEELSAQQIMIRESLKD